MRAIILAFAISLCGAIAAGEPQPEPESLGLHGNVMAQAERRAAAVEGGGAYARVGRAPVGSLVAKSAGSDAEPGRVLGLRTLEVSAALDGLCARTTIKHVFFNATDSLLEGVFNFTLPPGAAVDRFAMTIVSENDLMEGSLVDAGQAHQVYDTLVFGRAVDPGILEWTGANTFRATIFPIPAQRSKTIVISYLQPLRLALGAAGRHELRYQYPIDAKSVSASEIVFEAQVTPPAGASVEASPRMESSSDNGGGRRYACRFPPGSAAPDEVSLAMFWPAGAAGKTAESAPPVVLQAHRDARAGESGEGCLALALPPPSASRPPAAAGPSDVVFMLDTSASRTPAQLAACAEMVESVLRAMKPGDRFAIVLFDILPRGFSEDFVPVNPDTSARAARFLSQQHPLGATDVAAACEAVKDAWLAKAGKNVCVVYAGDLRATYGVTAPAALREKAQAALGDCRIIPAYFGAGASANAKQTGCEDMADFFGAEALDLAALSTREGGEVLAARISSPAWRNVSLWLEYADGTRLDIAAPRELEIGLGLTALARYARPGRARVHFSAELQGEKAAGAWEVDLPASEPLNAGLRKLLARQDIGHCESRRMAAEAAALAKANNLLSRATAFLVLESEKMYAEFHIQRGQPRQREELRSRMLAAAPVPRAPELKDAPPAGPPADLSGVKLLSAKQLSRQMNATREVGGVMMKFTSRGIEVPARQKPTEAPLLPQQCLERRLKLTSLIAAERGLPLEPEIVYPLLWLNVLDARAGNSPRESAWLISQAQPEKAPGSWGRGANAVSRRDLVCEKLRHPVKPTVWTLSASGKAVEIEGHLLAHELFASLLAGKSPAHLRDAGDSEINRAATTQRKFVYDLRGAAPERLAAAWNFLAQVMLAEGRPQPAGECAERAVQALGSSRNTALVLDCRLTAALAAQLGFDGSKAAEHFQALLENQAALPAPCVTKISRLVVENLWSAQEFGRATKLLESWCKISEQPHLLVLARAYLEQDRRLDAIRALSSLVETKPELAKLYPQPSDFLNALKP